MTVNDDADWCSKPLIFINVCWRHSPVLYRKHCHLLLLCCFLSHFKPHLFLVIVLPEPRPSLDSQFSLWENKPHKRLIQPVLQTSVCHWLTFFLVDSVLCQCVFSLSWKSGARGSCQSKMTQKRKGQDPPEQIWYVITFVQSFLNGTCTVSRVTLYRWWGPVHSTSCCIYRGCRTGKENFLFLIVFSLTSASVLSSFSIFSWLKTIQTEAVVEGVSLC